MLCRVIFSATKVYLSASVCDMCVWPTRYVRRSSLYVCSLLLAARSASTHPPPPLNQAVWICTTFQDMRDYDAVGEHASRSIHTFSLRDQCAHGCVASCYRCTCSHAIKLVEGIFLYRTSLVCMFVCIFVLSMLINQYCFSVYICTSLFFLPLSLCLT